MNIIVVGDFSPDLDEGYKNTSHCLAHYLCAKHQVVRLNTKQSRAISFWRAALTSRATIIHTIAQPTSLSIILTRLLMLLRPGSRTVISALKVDRYFVNGRVTRAQRLLLALAKPHVILVQSALGEQLFRSLGCDVRQLPNGVDLTRFHPVDARRQRELRLQHGLDPDRPVVLHVGHLEPARNLEALAPSTRSGMQVVVAGSLYMGRNNDLIGRLEALGLHILQGYQPQVEQLYMLADCYVFPLPPGNSLTMPLSVLEAMACNLPVITTRFSGLVESFREGQGLRFIDPDDDMLVAVQEALDSESPVTTREQVRGFSWESITQQAEAFYQEILS